jgi:hypothetical protein
VCTRLKTEHNVEVSYHISVHEDDFALIDNAGVWPQGVLITPFYERLNPDQIYSSEYSRSSRPHSPVSHDPLVLPCVPSDISGGACPGGAVALA